MNNYTTIICYNVLHDNYMLSLHDNYMLKTQI